MAKIFKFEGLKRENELDKDQLFFFPSFFFLSRPILLLFFSPAPIKKQATYCTTHLRKPNSGSALLCSSSSVALALWVRISLIFGFLDFSFHAHRPPPNPPASVCLLQILV
ncbi:hypothetical protein SLEP1_g6589 [Rubroshorea leprosula]|nr:hypothetical protein SLEP1_g6589 [Rubroshorea leprosula]